MRTQQSGTGVGTSVHISEPPGGSESPLSLSPGDRGSLAELEPGAQGSGAEQAAGAGAEQNCLLDGAWPQGPLTAVLFDSWTVLH